VDSFELGTPEDVMNTYMQDTVSVQQVQTAMLLMNGAGGNDAALMTALQAVLQHKQQQLVEINDKYADYMQAPNWYPSSTPQDSELCLAAKVLLCAAEFDELAVYPMGSIVDVLDDMVRTQDTRSVLEYVLPLLLQEEVSDAPIFH
jgi:hypothetical protein